MTLLDAYALVAFLVGGPAAPQVRGLLREGETRVATINLAEALDVSKRLYGLPVTLAMGHLRPLLGGPLGVVPLDMAIAEQAADVRARHYHRASRPISLGDAVLIASAAPSSRVATSDPDVLAVCRAEAVAIVELPGQG